MLIIKRYKNRKLYNTSGKDYITLLELGNLIRKGAEIFVTDDQSKQNITALVLSQVLTEQIRHTAYVPDVNQSQTPDAQKAELAATLHAVLRSYTTRISDTGSKSETEIAS